MATAGLRHDCRHLDQRVRVIDAVVSIRSLLGGLCCKTRVLFKARPDLSIAEPVVFSTVPSGGAID